MQVTACSSFTDTVQKQLMDRHLDGSAWPGGELLRDSCCVQELSLKLTELQRCLQLSEISWPYPLSSLPMSFALDFNGIQSNPNHVAFAITQIQVLIVDSYSLHILGPVKSHFTEEGSLPQNPTLLLFCFPGRERVGWLPHGELPVLYGRQGGKLFL